MRLAIVLVVALGWSAFGSAGEEPAPAPQPNADMAVVKSFCGKDIRRLAADSQDTLAKSLTHLCKRPEPEFRPVGLFPAYVWDFGSDGKSKTYLVLERDDIVTIPGTTRVRLTLLSENSNKIGESEFNLGGRTLMENARLARLPGLDFPAIELHAFSWSGSCVRQFYAFNGTRFDIIRVTDKDGIVSRNHYFAGGGNSGPPAPQQSEEKWEADLCRGNRAEILRALTWLGGIHDAGARAAPLKPGVGTAPKVRARPAVAAKLRELSKRGDAWERDMAALALDPKDYTFK